MSEISGVFLIQKTYMRSLRKKLKKHNYDYVILPTTKKKWVYFIIDENEDHEEQEEDFDENIEDTMDEIDWDLSLCPKTLKNLRSFSESFPILFLEYVEDYGWGFIFLALGELKGGMFLDYDDSELSSQDIKDQLRMANFREFKLIGLKRSEIKEIREILDVNLILQDIQGELEVPLVQKFLNIVGIEGFRQMSWDTVGYINDPQFLKFQRRFILRPLKQHGFTSYKTSDLGRICDGSILQYIEFEKSEIEDDQYFVNVWIRPLFSGNFFKGIGGPITLFPQISTHGGEFWSEETKSDLKLVRKAVMEQILPWLDLYSSPIQIINQFEQNREKKLKPLTDWSDFDLAMMYLWTHKYDQGAKYIKKVQVKEEKKTELQNLCGIILNFIETGKYEKIQTILEKNVTKIKKALKKMKKNFITISFGSSIKPAEEDYEEDEEEYGDEEEFEEEEEEQEMYEEDENEFIDLN